MATYTVNGVVDARSSNLSNIDEIKFEGSLLGLVSYFDLTINASQIGGSGISSTATIRGLPGNSTVVGALLGTTHNINIVGGSADISGWNMVNWTDTSLNLFERQIVYDGNNTGVRFVGSNGGHDVINGGTGNDYLEGGIANLLVTGNRINAGAGNDTLVSSRGSIYERGFDGGQGFDTLVVDRSSSTAGFTTNAGSSNQLNIVDISGSTWSATNIEQVLLRGGSGVDTLRGLGSDDTLIGNAGNDFLYGGAANDTLDGGSGADLLDGGSGTDLAAYYSSGTGLVVDLLSPGLNSGDAAGDVYVSIEGIAGTAFADSLRGDGNANILYGNEGNDILFGRGGDDLVLGGQGDDNIFGEEGNDALYGGDGDDVLTGGLGADLLVGEDGIDLASYFYAATAVTADLAFASFANTGEATGDGYVKIEGLKGSNLDDSLRGNDAINYLYGGDGNDQIYGRGGFDIIVGEGGNDYLSGGEGNDTFVFAAGAGSDTIADFEGGLGGTDVLLFYSSLGVSSYNDVMSRATQYGNDVRFDFADGTNVTVANMNMAHFAQDDFLFA